MNSSKIKISAFIESLLNSYTQVFFSNNKIFALALIIVSFFDLYAGISGMLAVIISNAMAFVLGFNRFNIRSGYYGFNSLLVGLGVGVFFQPSVEFYVFLIFTAILTLFITVSLEGIIGKYGLPYLSISFLFGIWMVTLAAREFSALEISERGIYNLNEMYMLGGLSMVNIYEWFNNLPLHESIKIYFRSLGAIFFQYHLFAGLLIALGLLIYSRIAFLLSIIGFYAAYYFYHFIGADISELSYSYIGFNYILSAIAVGGFFVVPSRLSVLWVILLTPLLSITITSTSALFSIFQLSIFSLPFNIIVLLFLYVMKFRERYFKSPELVAVQQFSPEKNLYVQRNFHKRFHDLDHVSIGLPFWGEWKVTQAHDGEMTHKSDWKHAWDFEIFDDEGQKFKGRGNTPEDYYAYNKPIVAPADGYVQEIVDGIEDNKIGDMNLERNWGNSIVIKHREKVFSQISHIKADSFKVTRGEFVKKGDVLAYCGNSGRSPEPHIHFQLQETPHVGSKTVDYPVSHYILNHSGKYELKTFRLPEKDQLISNIGSNDTLKKALHFVAGQKMKFEVRDESGREQIFEWEVQTDILNNTYILCKTSGAKAYLKNEGDIHSFVNYMGKKNTLLYYFYLGAFKIVNGFYRGLKVEDEIPVSGIKLGGWKILQDFLAPFYIFIRPKYSLLYHKSSEDISGSAIELHSTAELKIGGKVVRALNFVMYFGENELKKFVIRQGKQKTEAINISKDGIL
ncbi:MAG: urea transporter [Bacteroidales bacterium]|nr:urea transporter [Bacteroidales bacterium]MCF8386567.1 urea transporter [Bacteroidales bacterium]MCF8397780.1 urea transporter [Bacteroidales bacterium]